MNIIIYCCNAVRLASHVGPQKTNNCYRNINNKNNGTYVIFVYFENYISENKKSIKIVL